MNGHHAGATRPYRTRLTGQVTWISRGWANSPPPRPFEAPRLFCDTQARYHAAGQVGGAVAFAATPHARSLSRFNGQGLRGAVPAFHSIRGFFHKTLGGGLEQKFHKLPESTTRTTDSGVDVREGVGPPVKLVRTPPSRGTSSGAPTAKAGAFWRYLSVSGRRGRRWSWGPASDLFPVGSIPTCSTTTRRGLPDGHMQEYASSHNFQVGNES